MSSSYGAAQPAPEVEHFRPTSGTGLGWMSLVVTAAVVVYLLGFERTAGSITTAFGLVFAGTVVWMTMVRPRARADRRTLVLRNAASDTHVPLRSVEAVVLRQTLVVHTAVGRFVCIGIGKSTRALVRGRRRGDDGGTPKGVVLAADYGEFVAARITQLAEGARLGGAPEEPVRRAWAWPEITLLGLSALGFVVSIAL